VELPKGPRSLSLDLCRQQSSQVAPREETHWRDGRREEKRDPWKDGKVGAVPRRQAGDSQQVLQAAEELAASEALDHRVLSIVCTD